MSPFHVTRVETTLTLYSSIEILLQALRIRSAYPTSSFFLLMMTASPFVDLLRSSFFFFFGLSSLGASCLALKLPVG